MEEYYNDFETYKRNIWNSNDVTPQPQPPDYAYFCWRWDEKDWREGKKNSYPRMSDPIEDKNFRKDVLESFVKNQEMYYLQLEGRRDRGLEFNLLAMLLWEMYGHTPTRLLHMWRWAKSSDAFSICTPTYHARCGHSACKAWEYYSMKYVPKSMTSEADSYYQGAGAEILAELDPSLTSFNEKLWSDFGDPFRNKLSFGPSRPETFPTRVFLGSLQSFLFAVYDELISRTIRDAIKILKIPTKPDVSFLLIDGERGDRQEQRLNAGQNSSKFPLISFAVAGSGKTQSLFNLLATNWGHYLVSGHISNSPTHQDSILSPRRGGASADTQWLFELSERLKTKNGQALHPDYYSDAISELLANRQTLMERWITKLSGAGHSQSIYWLLFQTTCTPRYEPFVKTLELRMLLDPCSKSRTLKYFSPTVIDEAQNELNPFWNQKPPLIDFLKAVTILENAQKVVSISGTSLRMKDCRDVVCKAGSWVTQPQHVEEEIESLSRAFVDSTDRQECSHITEKLVCRVLEHYNDESREKQLSDFLQGTGLRNILGDFYFSLNRAKQEKDESTYNLLEGAKDFLIPILGRYHQHCLCTQSIGAVGNIERIDLKKEGSLEDTFKKIFNLHNLMMRYHEQPFVARQEHSLVELLREKFTPSSLSHNPKFSIHLILSNQRFSTLLRAHIKRLLGRIGYFCSLGEETFKHEFWKIACPETMVSQSIEGADRREEFFLQAKALLEQRVNANSPTADEWQRAADSVAGEFLQPERKCGITKYSALFRGRMRWSTVYIEHVFVSCLKTLELVSTQTNKGSRNINSSIDASGSIQDFDKSGFMDAEGPVFETAKNSKSSAMLFQIEEKAKEAAKYIKSSLKHRIEVLKSKGHYLLLKDLYSTAIRADLMHRPSIFPKDTSARMITEGFALLDPAESTYAPKQKLSEPIVVDAVIEYLRDMDCKDEDNLEKVLQNFLFDNQDDASSFGKAAEFYFAWSLGGLFAQSSDGLDLSLKARENFRQRIAQAKFIPTDGHICTQVLGSIQDYDRYILEEPSPDSEPDLILGSTITFPEWLRRVNNEEFFPTFHFPSTHAGPDIVFCLKSQITKQRILCAFQIKTGEKCHQDDAFRLIRTLDPSLWFWNAPDLREALDKELEAWKSHRILTALVITSRPCKEFFASESDFCDGMIQLQRPIRDWESCRKLNLSKAYKDLKSEVDKLKMTASLPEQAISILETAKSFAKELTEKVKSSVGCDPTLFARALIREVEDARKRLENAATSIYKDRDTRVDKKAEPNDILMPDCGKDGIPPPGYYFVILDDIALESFLGSTFHYLCKTMKEFGIAVSEGQELRCPVAGCKKPYKSKAWLDKHMEIKHSEYEPKAKRRKLNSSVVGNGSQARNSDNEDVDMAEAGEFE